MEESTSLLDSLFDPHEERAGCPEGHPGNLEVIDSATGTWELKPCSTSSLAEVVELFVPLWGVGSGGRGAEADQRQGHRALQLFVIIRSVQNE